MSKLLCACLIFLGLTSIALAFECYACDSILDPRCRDLANSFVPHVVPCSGQQCYKATIELGIVVRGCYFPGVCDRNSPNCHVCDTERCNSATNMKAFVLLGLATAFLLYLL